MKYYQPRLNDCLVLCRFIAEFTKNGITVHFTARHLLYYETVKLETTKYHTLLI